MTQSVANRLEELLELFHKDFLGGGTDVLVDGLSTFEEEHCGDVHDAELGGGVGALLHVAFHGDHLAFVFLGDLLTMGSTFLQGPHQVAPKSTITGSSDFRTTSSKRSSVI